MGGLLLNVLMVLLIVMTISSVIATIAKEKDWSQDKYLFHVVLALIGFISVMLII